MIARSSVLALLALGCTVASSDYEYVRCATARDCAGPAACTAITWRDGSGAMCTTACAMPSECPHGGHCVDVALDGTFRCYEPCVVDGDCPTGFVCQPLTTGASVCLPQ